MAICIVDDSEIVRKLVKQTFQVHGYNEIIEAVDGVDALEKAKQNLDKIELYVLDVNMPNMDGITLVGELRKLNTDAPIIMLTTESDKAKMVKAKSLGATGWVIKPFEGEKFMKIVDMFLKKK